MLFPAIPIKAVLKFFEIGEKRAFSKMPLTNVTPEKFSEAEKFFEDLVRRTEDYCDN